MQREQKKSKEDDDGGEQKGERLVEKLNRRRFFVGQNGAERLPSTPAHISTIHRAKPSSVSSRKLGATLWEFHQYYHPYPLPSAKMHRGTHGTAALSHRRQQRNGGFRDTGLDLSRLLPDASPSSHQPESASSLRRHIAQTLMKHHQSIEQSNHALQPVSPASYGSSLEIAPYNPAVTPGSSLEFRGRVGETRYNLKTSTELLKVLNRIWSLEEQHASNVSLIKALKTELAHARARIKELLRDQQADRHELDDLMKQIAENKLSRKTKEHDRINAAMQSMRKELEDERKLRKRSEGFHRKLARDLSEIKTTLCDCMKELEKERKSKKLLENLCDEFAKGIKSYDQEVHVLNQKSDKGLAGKDDQDRMILHLAESWLDERMQTKLEEAGSGFENSVLGKLGLEIETSLQAKKQGASKNRRSSLESVPLNDAISAPRDADDEEDSGGSDSNCFELKKPSDSELNIKKPSNSGTVKSNSLDKDGTKGQTQTPSSLQVKFEEQMAWAMSCNNKTKSRVVDTEEGTIEIGNRAEISMSRRTENCEITEEGSHENKNAKLDEETVRSNHVMDNTIRNHLSRHHEIDHSKASCSYPSRRQASPVRQWMSRTITPDLDVSESFTKPTQGTKDNTLKAKLIEARSKSSRPRLRLFKGIS